jgi:amidase
MKRREFLGALAATAAAPAFMTGAAIGDPASGARRHKPRRFAFEEFTIEQLQAEMVRKRTTALGLARAYLVRIDEIDRRGPALRAVIELNPDAEAVARERDVERRAGKLRGPLHGIPVLVKDNLDTGDRMATSAGSLALADSHAARDSFVVERLRAAGAVLLGKTNLSEWANFRGSNSISGWSARGGRTRNPYALNRNPSGSSSGSGAATSANLCAAAIGTETDGSITSPSNVNGLVGVKPTVGLVSRAGIVPISASQDTAGPMARTVRDAALILGVIAGADPRDPATAAIPAGMSFDFVRSLDAGALRGARLGVVREFFGFHPGAERLMNGVLAHLKELGAELIDPVELPHGGDRDRAEFEVLLYEFKAGLNAYLGALPAGARVHSLADVIAFNESHSADELRWFGQETMIKAEAKGPLTDKAYLDALAACRKIAREEGIDGLMQARKLDALIAPTGGPAWVTDMAVGDTGVGSSTSPAAVAGYPAVTVPAVQMWGLPMGLTFFGRAWTEPRLLSLAYAFEQATRARKPPQFFEELPTTGA